MATIANPSPEKVIARMSECLRRLMESGLDFDALQIPISDPLARERLVKYWRCGTFENGTSIYRAREIMGNNLLGTHDMLEGGKMKVSVEERIRLQEVPWKPEQLEEYKKDYVLVAYSPTSLVELMFPKDDWWWRREKFGTKKLKAGWYLLPKKTVPRQMIYKPAPPILIVYASIAYGLTTGHHLYEDEYVDCGLVADGETPLYLRVNRRPAERIADFYTSVPNSIDPLLRTVPFICAE